MLLLLLTDALTLHIGSIDLFISEQSTYKIKRKNDSYKNKMLSYGRETALQGAL